MEESTIEKYIEHKFSDYYKLIVELGEQNRVFSHGEYTVRLNIIPSSDLAIFKKWKDTSETGATILLDQWYNYMININKKQYKSSEKTIQGISQNSVDYTIDRTTDTEWKITQTATGHSIVVTVLKPILFKPSRRILFATIKSGAALKVVAEKHQFKKKTSTTTAPSKHDYKTLDD